MNIIEAFQAAESNRLITNSFYKKNHLFLKYISGGVFFMYELIDQKPVYKYEVREFTLSQIIDISWEAFNEDFEFKGIYNK